MSGFRIEPANACDVPELAALHRAALPASMISMLGAGAVERYYSLVTTSASEQVFVARSGGNNRQVAEDMKQRGGAGTVAADGAGAGEINSTAAEGADQRSTTSHTVAAGCVLALEPHTVLPRFARHAPLLLAAGLARGVLDARFRRRLVARLREGGGDDVLAGVPEVIQIFTQAGQRSRGLGSALLRACEDRLRGLGHLRYCIHTLQDHNDAGIRFYRREGFTESGSACSFGDNYLVMTKGLT